MKRYCDFINEQKKHLSDLSDVRLHQIAKSHPDGLKQTQASLELVKRKAAKKHQKRHDDTSFREVQKGWYTHTIHSFEDKLDGRAKAELHVDVSRSRYDKRDWHVSTRDDHTLQPDRNHVKTFGSKEAAKLYAGDYADYLKGKRDMPVSHDDKYITASVQDQHTVHYHKGHAIEKVDHGYGKEYSLYKGSKEDHLRGKSDWVGTYKSLKHAKDAIPK